MISWKIFFYLLDECFTEVGFFILAIRQLFKTYKGVIKSKGSHIYYGGSDGEFKSRYNGKLKTWNSPYMELSKYV